ncbi:MAG: hypothetical protein ABFS21_04720 [Actinomycetota bacterium]
MRRLAIGAAFLLLVSPLAACNDPEAVTPPPPETTAPATTAAPTTSTTAAPAPARSLAVPAHAPPAIDGILDAGEWDGSATVTMTDGSALHWMHDQDVLFVALESDAVGAVNLVLATEDEVWILHSSAALGSALYLRGPEVWELSHGFAWCCRSATDDSPRMQLLEEEGWQANIGFSGDDGIVEYEVTLPWDGALVAVSYLTDAETSAFWPADLSSGARDQLVGPPPPERDYNLDEWFTLVSSAQGD